MRYLHSVGISETFIASGKYIHHSNGQPTGSFEEWSIHQLPDGAQMIRVDMDARADQGRSILIEAWMSPLNKIERVDISAYGQDADEVGHGRATYTFYKDHVEIGRTLDKNPRIFEEVELPQDYIIYPGGTLFLGYAVAQNARFPDSMSVFAVDLHMKANLALQGEIHQQSAVLINEETITLGEKQYNARQFERVIPFYEVLLPHLWLDEHNILLRHDVPESASHTTLTNYAHRK